MYNYLLELSSFNSQIWLCLIIAVYLKGEKILFSEFIIMMILKNKFLILNFRIKFLRFLLDWWRIKFIGVFVHFLETYQVPKFWIVKSYLNISDNIQNMLSKKYASQNMDFLLMSFCFMMKNDHFEAPSKWENNLA